MSTRRILVPVDLSEGSKRALRFAVDLAKPLGAIVDVLHVWEPTPEVSPTNLIWMHGSQDSFWDNLKADLVQQIEAIAAEVDPDRKIIHEVFVLADYVANCILHKLETGGYDMCVLGTRGRTGIARLLLGSVAGRVVRLSPCPVITVPAPHHAEASKTEKRSEGTGFDLSTPTNL